VRAIQELVGHRDLSMTLRYMHVSPAAIESAIQLLDRPSAVQSRGETDGRVGALKTLFFQSLSWR